MAALACPQQQGAEVEEAGPCLEMEVVEVEAQMVHQHPAWGEAAGELMDSIRVEVEEEEEQTMPL
jgi:hypothetical protein